MRLADFLAAAVLGLAFMAPAAAQRAEPAAPRIDDIRLHDLPIEAQETIVLIRKGGPYPYAKDGAVFGNREGILPRAKRGYYREYTVKTPGVRSRGARRIVAGASGELYFSDDHYNRFRRIRE